MDYKDYTMNNVIISQNKHWEHGYKNLYDRDVFQKLYCHHLSRQLFENSSSSL